MKPSRIAILLLIFGLISCSPDKPESNSQVPISQYQLRIKPLNDNFTISYTNWNRADLHDFIFVEDTKGGNKSFSNQSLEAYELKERIQLIFKTICRGDADHSYYHQHNARSAKTRVFEILPPQIYLEPFAEYQCSSTVVMIRNQVTKTDFKVSFSYFGKSNLQHFEEVNFADSLILERLINFDKIQCMDVDKKLLTREQLPQSNVAACRNFVSKQESHLYIGKDLSPVKVEVKVNLRSLQRINGKHQAYDIPLANLFIENQTKDTLHLRLPKNWGRVYYLNGNDYPNPNLPDRVMHVHAFPLTLNAANLYAKESQGGWQYTLRAQESLEVELGSPCIAGATLSGLDWKGFPTEYRLHNVLDIAYSLDKQHGFRSALHMQEYLQHVFQQHLLKLSYAQGEEFTLDSWNDYCEWRKSGVRWHNARRL